MLHGEVFIWLLDMNLRWMDHGIRHAAVIMCIAVAVLFGGRRQVAKAANPETASVAGNLQLFTVHNASPKSV